MQALGWDRLNSPPPTGERHVNEQDQVMQEQLGLGVIPGAGWRAAEISQIAREAEEAGFTRYSPPRSTTTS